jgi:hypothetical protein
MDENPFLSMLRRNFPDHYAAGRKADDDLSEISARLAEVASTIIAGRHGVKPADAGGRLADDEQGCIRSATSWIKANYRLPEMLADEYGKQCLGDDQAQEERALASQAAALSEPDTAAALRQGMQAISRAGASIVLQAFFMMGGPEHREEVETATRKMKDAIAAARAFVEGLAGVEKT